MKVKDLIAKLENVNPELEVISAKDDEWNGFKKTYSVGEMYSPELEDYNIETVYGQQELNDMEYDDKLNCVVIG